jgi:hypothetical protein
MKETNEAPKRYSWEEWLSENLPNQITSSSIRFAKSAFEDHNGLIEYQAARIKELEDKAAKYKRNDKHYKKYVKSKYEEYERDYKELEAENRSLIKECKPTPIR